MIQNGNGATFSNGNGNHHPEVSDERPAQFKAIPEIASYPTGSLDFLTELQKGDREAERPSGVSLDIIIVGAGLGGLSAAVALALRGHKVTVFEQAPALGEVGAGIQIPSNSARLLLKWGLGPYLQGKVVEPDDIKLRRWEDGKVIGLTRLVPEFRDKFDAPYYVVHRAHFHAALYERALSLGVTVRINSRVKEYDAAGPHITLMDGSVHGADLVVAADGIQSKARSLIAGNADVSPVQTGFAAYRATVDVEKMHAHPETSWLLEKAGLNLWLGDLRHVMTYTIAGGKSFNMVLSHPDFSDPKTWKQDEALETMRAEFKGWDQTLTRVISMVDETLKWPLVTGKKVEHWVHPGEKLVIMGDAAHAMVPYMSQGAAMAVEDAGALAQALSFATKPEEVGASLRLWESVRVERASQMQEASLLNGKIWHFKDGAEQRARDEAMRHEVEGTPFASSPNQWTDPTTQRWCYAYDAEEEISLAWRNRKTTGR